MCPKPSTTNWIGIAQGNQALLRLNGTQVSDYTIGPFPTLACIGIALPKPHPAPRQPGKFGLAKSAQDPRPRCSERW